MGYSINIAALSPSVAVSSCDDVDVFRVRRATRSPLRSSPTVKTMRIKFLLSCYVVVIVAGLFCARASAIQAQQFLPRDPTPPIAPTESSQCNAYSQAWSKLDAEITRLHRDCLDANEKNKSQRPSEGRSGVGSRCSFSSCQSLHTRMYEVQSERDSAVESCYTAVEKYQENQRAQREAEEQRQREIKERQEREEREREEQKEKEAAQREREQAEKQKSSDEADRAHKREDTSQKLIQLAAEQQRREQEALARRTEERQRQMDELKTRKDKAEDRYQQNVKKQTRDKQDELLAQMRSKAGAENTVFPITDANNSAGQEFDLSSVPRGTSIENGRDAAGSLPQLPPQYEESIAPEKDSFFSNAFRNVRDFASPILEQGKTMFVQELREITQQNINEVRDTIVAGVLNDDESARTAESMFKQYFDDSYKNPTREILNTAFDSSAGGLLDEAAADISKSVAKSLGETSPHAGLVGALADVAIKNGAEKLSDYARDTFVDSMSGKFSEVYRNISDKLIGSTDPVTQPVQDTAILRLPALVSKIGTPAAAAKAVYDYGTHMVNAMGEMFDRLIKSEFFGTAPPDSDPDK
jgi:hypothetical protein